MTRSIDEAGHLISSISKTIGSNNAKKARNEQSMTNELRSQYNNNTNRPISEERRHFLMLIKQCNKGSMRAILRILHYGIKSKRNAKYKTEPLLSKICKFILEEIKITNDEHIVKDKENIIRYVCRLENSLSDFNIEKGLIMYRIKMWSIYFQLKSKLSEPISDKKHRVSPKIINAM